MGFIGYRAFNLLVFNGEPILTSLNPRPHYYKYFGPIANGAEPAMNNHRGFYAFKSLNHLEDAFSITFRYRVNQTYSSQLNMPHAEIEMFGTVIEHSHGYRSSKLLFRRIYIPSFTLVLPQITLLENRYQCEVELLSSRKGV